MKRIIPVQLVCCVIFCASIISPAQQPAQSAPQGLDGIAFMKGDWAGKQVFNNPDGPSLVGDATDRVEIGIGGKYLCETLSTTVPGRKPTDTRHFISFDKQSGTYAAWWFNDTGTHPTEFAGELSDNKLVLTSKSAGMGSVLRATYQSPSKDTLTFLLEMKQGDSWTRLFLTTYSRKSDAGQP